MFYDNWVPENVSVSVNIDHSVVVSVFSLIHSLLSVLSMQNSKMGN